MGYWNTRGLRGSSFEEMINMTNKVYRRKEFGYNTKSTNSNNPDEARQKQGCNYTCLF